MKIVHLEQILSAPPRSPSFASASRLIQDSLILPDILKVRVVAVEVPQRQVDQQQQVFQPAAAADPPQSSPDLLAEYTTPRISKPGTPRQG